MITTKDKIGFIRRYTETDGGKERFRFIEAKITGIRVGKTRTSVYTDRFRALDLEEIESNTQIIEGKNLILVNEPFVTNDERSAHYREVVDYWNEYGAKSIFDDLLKGETE